jgi:hypothetical protein
MNCVSHLVLSSDRAAGSSNSQGPIHWNAINSGPATWIDKIQNASESLTKIIKYFIANFPRKGTCSKMDLTVRRGVGGITLGVQKSDKIMSIFVDVWAGNYLEIPGLAQSGFNQSGFIRLNNKTQ